MRCGQVREAISARLDGEDGTDAAATVDAVDTHLVNCQDCARWERTAAMVTRMARLGPADLAEPMPAEKIIADVRLPKPARWPDRLRIALVMIAVVQLVLGATQLAAGSAHAAMVAHLGNESAAFNLAVGVALAWVAWRPRQARSQLPLLVSFLGVLAVVSGLDLVGERVSVDRLATHVPMVLGLAVTVLLSRVRRHGVDPGDGRVPVRGPLPVTADDVPPEPLPVPALTVASGHRRPPAARREVA